jgi:hypothetical protein
MESFINSLQEKFSKHFKNPVRFSSTSKKLINEIVNLMIESNDYYESHKSKFHLEKNNTMPKCNMMDIIPTNITKHIENMKAINYVYKFNIHSKQYTVSFYTNLTDEIIQEYMKKVYMLLYIVYTYANKDCSKNLNIYLYLTDLKKVLPTHTKVLKEENVNTAFTTSCKPHAEIVLFRQEEWFKVLIHECFHCNGLDFSTADTSGCDKTILEIFPVTADVRLYETYCEMWGEIINVLFISYFAISNSMKIKENLDVYIHKIVSKGEKLLHNERMFSMFQSSKILHFFGIDYKQLYDKQDINSHKVRQIKYKEETSILSYYILKNIYIFFVNEFLEWCVENNIDKHGNESLVFSKTKETINSYCEFIKCRYTNYKFVNCVLDFEKWLDCSIDIHPSIYNSMRMTVYGDK